MSAKVKRIHKYSWRQLRVLCYRQLLRSRKLWRYVFLFFGIGMSYLTHELSWLLLAMVGLAIMIAEDIYPY